MKTLHLYVRILKVIDEMKGKEKQQYSKVSKEFLDDKVYWSLEAPFCILCKTSIKIMCVSSIYCYFRQYFLRSGPAFERCFWEAPC